MSFLFGCLDSFFCLVDGLWVWNFMGFFFYGSMSRRILSFYKCLVLFANRFIGLEC